MFCVPPCPIPIKDIISDTGYVRGCFDEEIEGILVQDKLREMFANPETENSEVFTMAQKEEFLYHLLGLVCIGGSMCQAEDKFQPWKSVTKELYKDLVDVEKDKNGNVSITSTVYQIDPSRFQSPSIFPIKSIHNKCYAIFSNKGDQITLIYKAFIPFW